MIGCINILKMNVLPKFKKNWKDWKACFVSWSRIIEGLDFTYLCFIAPKKEEVWDFRTFSGIIGQPNFLLPPAGLY